MVQVVSTENFKSIQLKLSEKWRSEVVHIYRRLYDRDTDIAYTSNHGNVCKFFKFKITFSRLKQHLAKWNFVRLPNNGSLIWCWKNFLCSLILSDFNFQPPFGRRVCYCVLETLNPEEMFYKENIFGEGVVPFWNLFIPSASLLFTGCVNFDISVCSWSPAFFLCLSGTFVRQKAAWCALIFILSIPITSRLVFMMVSITF